MIDCNLFDGREKELIREAFLSKLKALNIYTLEYEAELKICAYIQLVFEYDLLVTITTGDLADNLIILDESEFLKQKDNYLGQDGVEVILTVNKTNEEQLISFRCTQKPQEEYYWELDFVFEFTTLHIDALIDEVQLTIIPRWPPLAQLLS